MIDMPLGPTIVPMDPMDPFPNKPIGPLEGPGPKITWPGGVVKEFGKYAIRKIHETIIREIILFARPVFIKENLLRGIEEVALKWPEPPPPLRGVEGEISIREAWPTGWQPR